MFLALLTMNNSAARGSERPIEPARQPAPAAEPAGITAHDREALVDLLAQHADKLLDYIARRIPPKYRGVIAPEDVQQEVWKAIFQTPRSEWPPSRADAANWLRAVAQRKLFDSLRNAGAMKRGCHQLLGRQGTALQLLLTRLPQPQATPSGELSLQEARRAVQSAVSSLPESRREAILMYHIEGCSRPEIAERLGKSMPVVMNLLAEGRKQLRTILRSASRFHRTK